MFGNFFNKKNSFITSEFHYTPSYKGFHHITFGRTKKYFERIYYSAFGWPINFIRLRRRALFRMKSVLPKKWANLLPGGTAFLLANEKFVGQNSISTFFHIFFVLPKRYFIYLLWDGNEKKNLFPHKNGLPNNNYSRYLAQITEKILKNNLFVLQFLKKTNALEFFFLLFSFFKRRLPCP